VQYISPHAPHGMRLNLGNDDDDDDDDDDRQPTNKWSNGRFSIANKSVSFRARESTFGSF